MLAVVEPQPKSVYNESQLKQLRNFKLDLSRCQNDEETKAIDHNTDIEIKLDDYPKKNQESYSTTNFEIPQTPST